MAHKNKATPAERLLTKTMFVVLLIGGMAAMTGASLPPWGLHEPWIDVHDWVPLAISGSILLIAYVFFIKLSKQIKKTVLEPRDD